MFNTIIYLLFSGDIEIVLKGRGDKTVRPRSFTPVSSISSVSSTAAPIVNNKVIPEIPGQFSLGSVVVGASHNNKEELSFQPGLRPYKADNYRVTDFSHQTTAQGHTYR